MYSTEGAKSGSDERFGQDCYTVPKKREVDLDLRTSEGSPEMERIIAERNQAQRSLRQAINLHYRRGGLTDWEYRSIKDMEGDTGAFWDPHWLDVKDSDVII